MDPQGFHGQAAVIGLTLSFCLFRDPWRSGASTFTAVDLEGWQVWNATLHNPHRSPLQSPHTYHSTWTLGHWDIPHTQNFLTSSHNFNFGNTLLCTSRNAAMHWVYIATRAYTTFPWGCLGKNPWRISRSSDGRSMGAFMGWWPEAHKRKIPKRSVR